MELWAWMVEIAGATRRAAGRRGAHRVLVASACLFAYLFACLFACQGELGLREARSTGARAGAERASGRDSDRQAPGSGAGAGGVDDPAKSAPGGPETGGMPPDGPVGRATGVTPMRPLCRDTSERAQGILTEHCSGCHSDPGDAKGEFSSVLDVPALMGSGRVIPYDPRMSRLLQRMRDGVMPPQTVQVRPTDEEIDAIELWIACGAPDWTTPFQNSSTFLTTDWRLSTVREDLRSFSNPSERRRIRYLDLSHLRNAGHSPDQLELYRQAAWLVLNSLSRGGVALVPEAVDEDGLIYRIDLRDYAWDEDTWNRLEAAYPYAAIYDPDSRLFPTDERSAEQIREQTGTAIPIVQADWFISHASRPPLYFSLLGLPGTFGELERSLAVDIEDNIDDGLALRSGFSESEPSQSNRVIERHELPGNRGALWRTYDFERSSDFGNIFAHPLDFREAGGNAIFHLPNGLQAYYVMNAAGERLDKAPRGLIRDPAARDGAVEAGLSCMGCHVAEGVLAKYDEVRAFHLEAGPNAQQIEAVLKVYATRERLAEAFADDQARYQEALQALGIDALTETSMHGLDATHQGLLDLETVGAVVGITAEALKRAIDASPQAFPRELVTLRVDGGGIQRDAFDAIVGDLVEGLGLGEPLEGDDRVVSDDDDRVEQTQQPAGTGIPDAGDQPPDLPGMDSPDQQDEIADGDAVQGDDPAGVETDSPDGIDDVDEDAAPPERVLCQRADDCEQACGAGCSLACRDVNVCAPEVGPGSQVSCERVGACSPTCNGPCRVRCANVGSCQVTCAQGPPVSCGNGIIACGQGCPG